MNLRLTALRVYLPSSLRNERLRELFHLTAEAFRTPMPDTGGLSHFEELRSYAIFTREQAQQVNTERDMDSLKRRLFENAHRLGDELREQLNIETFGESLSAARLLYRALGIDFRANASGDVIIKQCYFSRFYSGQVCRLISSLDEGLIAGLSGGGRLSFTTRISEGHPCCLAKIDFNNRDNETGNRSRHRCRWCNGG